MTTRNTDVVVIGAGQAGLAASKHLTDQGVDHVVLERGTVGNSWTTERWDSLRLLTPNWLTRLPGLAYDGPDPDGYMTAAEVAQHLDRYRQAIAAPVVGDSPVRLVRRRTNGFDVQTGAGDWTARSVVLATGACGEPHIPAVAAELPDRVQQITPVDYRNPAQVAGDRVLVVGASASGIQIAEELLGAGKEVVLAVGEHIRLPRTYRGRDIHWWMDRVGVLDDRLTDLPESARGRPALSPQLVGTPQRRCLDLGTVQQHGARLAGRLMAVNGGRALFSGGLASMMRLGELRQSRLLDRSDAYVQEHGLAGEVGPALRPEPVPVPDPLLQLDLADVDAVVWATGYRPRWQFLAEGFTDDRGRLRHDGGVIGEGAFVLGMPFQRHRDSAFLGGVGRDAGFVAAQVRRHLDRVSATAA